MRPLATGLFLILSLLLSASTWAAPGFCTTRSIEIGDYTSPAILSDYDVKMAILCAVNRGGHKVIGSSTFRSFFKTRIAEADFYSIRLTRHTEAEPWFNQKNIFEVYFRAVHQERLRTRIKCTATVEFQQIPVKHVAISLKDCSANHFGTGDPPLEASAAFAIVP